MPHPGDPQSGIPAEDIITWLVRTVGHVWRYQRTVKLLSEIVKNGKLVLRWYIALRNIHGRTSQGLDGRVEGHTKP